MSYNNRIDDGNIYEHDDDLLVKHEGQIYLNINNVLFVPLKIVYDEEVASLVVNRDLDILSKSSEQEKIDNFKKEMGDAGDIVVQYDIPSNIESLPSLQLSDNQFEEFEEFEEFDLQDLEDYDSTEKGVGVGVGVGDATVAVENDNDEYTIIDELDFDFGTDSIVHINAEDVDIDLDDLIDYDDIITTGITINAKKNIYSDLDVNQIADLIPEHRELGDGLSLQKIQTLVRSMVQNDIKTNEYTSIGEKIFHSRGLPSWLIPITCSRINTDADVDRKRSASNGCYVNQNADTGGCYINVDVPAILAPHADVMLPDNPNEAPGKWNRARGEYAMNVIHNTDQKCDIESLCKQVIHREMAPEYKIRITLSPLWLKRVNQKTKEDMSETTSSNRLRCGRAYASAVAEAGGVGNINVVKDGTGKKIHVIGLLVRDIDKRSCEPLKKGDYQRVIAVKCAGKDHDSEFSAILNTVITETLNGNLTDEVFATCHNMRPLCKLLKRFNMDIRDLDYNVMQRFLNILHVNHPAIERNSCTACDHMDIGKSCSKCEQTGSSISWSKFHTDVMKKYTLHLVRDSVDRSHQHYYRKLMQCMETRTQYVVEQPPFQDRPSANPRKFVQPYSIQYNGGDLTYMYSGKMYVKDDYNALQRHAYYNTHRDAISIFLNTTATSETCRLATLALAYRQREQNTDNCLLGGLVIDILKNVPKGAVVVKYMDGIMENGDNTMYLEYLEEFQHAGLITYDTYHGRYVSSESGEIIICICHKTYIAQQNSFLGTEEFMIGDKCKYCLTTLNAELQTTDYSSFTGRDIYAGESEETENDQYLGLQTMFMVILELLESLMQKNGWILTDIDKNYIIGQLEDEKDITLDPYGKHVSDVAVSDKTADLRGFIQQQRSPPAILKVGKTLKIKTLTLSNNEFNIMNVISLYLKSLLPGTWPSKDKNNRLMDVNKSMFKTSDVPLEKNKVVIMSYYTLPILRLQGLNISIIISYLTSFIELKYGTKDDIDSNKFGQIMQEYVDTELIHNACNLYSEKMFVKYTSLLHMLNIMSLAQQEKKPYFNMIRRLYDGRQDDLQCFSTVFTDHYEILLRSGKKMYFDELLDTYNSTLKELRNTVNDYKRKVPGQSTVIRDNHVSLYFNPAPSALLVNITESDTIADNEECISSIRQQIMSDNGYLMSLRELYSDAEGIKDLTIGDQEITVGDLLDKQCADDCKPPVLGHMALYGCVAQGERLMSLPRNDKLEDYNAFEDTLEIYDLTNNVPLSPEKECSFLPDSLKQRILNGSDRVYPPLSQGSFDVPITQGHGHIGMLRENVLDHSYTAEFISKLRHLISYLENQEMTENDVSGIFQGKRHSYCFNIIPEISEMVITQSYNETRKKALEMINIDIYQNKKPQKVPDFMNKDEDDLRLYPWGDTTEPITIMRRAKQCQNIAKTIGKLIRWLGRPMSDDEKLQMQRTIKESKYSDVIGINKEFKIEKDQITVQGYVLPELYTLKMEDVNLEVALNDFEFHNGKLYDMTYHEYLELVTDKFSETWANPTAFLDAIYMCLKVDIMKHLEFIRQGTKTHNSVVNRQIQYNAHQLKFIDIVTNIIDILDANAGPSVIDPNRAEIDRLYELRFYEFAVKRSITTAKGARKKTGIDINTAYAGHMEGDIDFDDVIDDIDDGDDYDPEAIGDADPDVDPYADPEADPVEDGEFDPLEGIENTFIGDYD